MYMKHVLTSTQHCVLKLYIITLQIYYIIYIRVQSLPSSQPDEDAADSDKNRRVTRTCSTRLVPSLKTSLTFSRSPSPPPAPNSPLPLPPSRSSSLQLPSRSSSTSLNPIGTFSNKHVPPFSPWCCRCNSFASLITPSLNLVASDSLTAPLSVVIKGLQRDVSPLWQCEGVVSRSSRTVGRSLNAPLRLISVPPRSGKSSFGICRCNSRTVYRSRSSSSRRQRHRGRSERKSDGMATATILLYGSHSARNLEPDNNLPPTNVLLR